MSNSKCDQGQLFELASVEQPEKPRRKGWLKPTVVDETAVEQVWALYVETFWSGRGVRPKLSEPRKKLIGAVVAEYGVDVVLSAVRGCSLSEWHMGGNPSGKRYVSVELILRDPDHVERFADLAESTESKGGFLDEN